VVFLLLCQIKETLAQNDETTTQFWIDYNISGKISDRLKWTTGTGFRTISPSQWNRIYIDPSVSYDWPRLILKKMKYKEKLLAGLAVYYTDNKRVSDQLEIRPYQGYSISAPNWEYLVIQHTLRLEERFEMNVNDWVNTFGLRFRYKGQITFRFQGDIWKEGNGFYIPAGIELYWNLIGTKQFNDRANFDIGIGKEFNPKWKALISFGYLYSRNGVEETFDASGMKWRFRLYHRL
jgi:hypothetical protein